MEAFVIICSYLSPGFGKCQVSKPTGRIMWSEVTYLEKGGVFTHGSIAELRRLKGERVTWYFIVHARYSCRAT